MAEAKNELENRNDNPLDDRGTDTAAGLALRRVAPHEPMQEVELYDTCSGDPSA